MFQSAEVSGFVTWRVQQLPGSGFSLSCRIRGGNRMGLKSLMVQVSGQDPGQLLHHLSVPSEGAAQEKGRFI